MAKRIKMIKKLKYNYSEHGKGADIELEVDLSRFDIQYGRAQYELDSAIMTSMEKYMQLVLNAHYGSENASKEDVEYSRKMYEKLSERVYGQISVLKKCVFKIWKAY